MLTYLSDRHKRDYDVVLEAAKSWRRFHNEESMEVLFEWADPLSVMFLKCCTGVSNTGPHDLIICTVYTHLR